MKGISNLIKLVSGFAKYAAILVIIGETFEFFNKKLTEKYPNEVNNEKPTI
jgi:hypothetical protein